MTIEANGHEHEFEPQHGLPERLPQGERILWQGSPELGPIMRRVFHLPIVAVYFAVLLGLRASHVLPQAHSFADGLALMGPPLMLSAVALSTLAVLAWLTCRTTVYTLTNQRVVMRIGIVLTLTFNLPLSRLQSADLKRIDTDRGDIALALSGSDRIAWLHLWPHARPWRLARPEPMLRAVPRAAEVAQLLSQAWSEVHGAQGAASASRPAKSQDVSLPGVATAGASAHRSPAHHPDLSAAA